ncbi:MAG: lysylphosphatidylglycerol synthase domain-containing protein, partial [Moorellaceae bacterium]
LSLPFRGSDYYILFLAAVLIAIHLGQAQEIWRVFQRGNWGWMTVATLLQLVFLVNQTALYKVAYQMAKLPLNFKELFPLVTSATFVSAVFPGGTISGASLMIYDGLRRGREVSRILMANFIFYLLDYLAFLVLLVAALLYLFWRGSLQQYEIIATAFLLAVVGGLLAILFFTGVRPETVLNLIRRLIRLVSHLLGFMFLKKAVVRK